MDYTCYTTVGREIYPKLQVNICCNLNTDFLEEQCTELRFRIAVIKEGHGLFQNGDKSQIITSPAVLCLNHDDHVWLQKTEGIKMDIMYFNPMCFERYKEYRDYEEWRKMLGEDAYFFRAFFDRTDTYIGACSITQQMAIRGSQLINSADKELSLQNSSWPCRSRSYFIELLLSINSIYSEGVSSEKVYQGKINDFVMEVIDFTHSNYLDKMTLEDISKHFHTNKTTLNQRFKAVMGITVTEYIIHLRMQVACSLLRKTYLPVEEIRGRSGYHDDAHFLRAFKKFSGCTPTMYRNQYEGK